MPASDRCYKICLLNGHILRRYREDPCVTSGHGIVSISFVLTYVSDYHTYSITKRSYRRTHTHNRHATLHTNVSKHCWRVILEKRSNLGLNYWEIDGPRCYTFIYTTLGKSIHDLIHME